MAKKKETPHLDKWLRTFKNVGTTAGKVAVSTLGSMAPGVSETVTSTTDVLRESRAFMTKARNQIAYQSKVLNRNTTGRKAANIMNDAFNDIKNGEFKLNKLEDSSFDTLDDFDATIDAINSEISTAQDDPNATALAESKKNTAILGRVVAEGNMATIEGLSNMTATLSNVTIKTNQSMAAQMTNVALMGINQMNSGIAGVNGRLDAINQNLMSIMDFQRTNTAILHEQTLQYQSDTTQMMHEMGSVLSEMQDFIQQQKEIDKKKGPKRDPFDFSSGFNARTYIDMVKHNFNNSIFGMMKTMGGMSMSMAKMTGESPLQMFAPMVLSMMLPESLQKTVGRFDKSFTQGMNNILYRIGDMRNSSDFLKQTIGQIFGKERATVVKPKMGDFKRGAMSWNGEAQRYLTEVIPGYLARIEAGVTKSEARYYNSEKGVWQHEGRIRKDFNKDFVNTLEFNMNGFTEQLQDALKKSSISETDREMIRRDINESIVKTLMSDSISASRNRQDTMNLINASLQGKVDSRTIHDIVREATSGLDQTTQALNETLANLNSATRNLFTGQIKGKTADLFTGADIFSGKKFTASGKLFDDLSEFQRQQAEFSEMMNSDEGHGKIFAYAMEKMFGEDYKNDPRYKKRFEKYDPVKRKKEAERKRKARYQKFDNATDRMYDWMSGYNFRDPYDRNGAIRMGGPVNGPSYDDVGPINGPDFREDPRSRSFQAPAIIRPERAPKVQKASSRYTQTRRGGSNTERVSRNIERSIQTMDQRDYNASLNQSETRMTTQALATSRLVHQLHSAGNEAGPSTQAIIDDPGTAIAERLNENETSLKSMVLSLNDNFLSPIVGGLFGKNGFFRRIFSKDSMKKVKDFLFDEKDGVFKDVTPWFKDQMDYIRYTFNGKAYTDRKGVKHDENENSVFDHIAKGYDFIYSNTMKYLFGEDYKENETYDKYFKWLDFKGKRDKKRQERIKRAKELEEKEKARSQVNNNTRNVFINGNTAGMSLEDIEGLNSYEVGGYLPDNNVIDVPFKEVGANRVLSQHNRRAAMGSHNQARLALPGPVNQPEVVDAASFEIIPVEDARDMGETIQHNLILASETAADNIVESSTALSTAVIGDFGDENVEKQAEEAQKKSNKNFFDKFKKWLPKGLAAGLVGGLVGASAGIHGTGLLGSLILPGGPISGAILGVAGSILMKSDTFQKVMFGEKQEDGKRTGGLISNKTQEFFKKNLPLIVGTATIGALKGLIRGTAAAGPGGFLLNTLLPGGPIGGAILGLGIGLLRNNERFNKILFGEKNADGKRDGGILSKGMSGVKKAFSKSMHFVKGGLKGAAIGAGTGLALGQMGLIGSALSLGGPVGMGLMGLGLGIASQADRVKTLLFGTEEFDENGNSKGRRKDGLFHKVRNMLVMNVFDPIKTHLTEKVEDFAYWAKDKIMYPFRLAFGPILDSMKGIKKDISDAVHTAFNNIAETVGKAMKTGVEKLFKPLTSVMGKIGKIMTTSITAALKLSLAPLTGGLKIAQFATRGLRKRAKGEERKTIRDHLGTIYTGVRDATKAQWENDDRDYGTGIGGKINKFLTRGRDIFVNTKQGFDAAHAAYREEMGEQGFNSLNWMNVEDERKMDKKNRKKLKKDRKRWREIDKVRNEVAREHNFGEAYLSSEGLDIVRERFEKAGLDKGLIKNNEDLNNLLYNRTDFIDNLDKDKTGEAKIKDSAATQDFYATTKDYQKYVMGKFDFITREFTKFAAQNALARKENLSISDLSDIDKDLKSKGLTWKDIGINPSRLASYGSISDSDWEKYMDEKFSDGEVKDDPTGFSKMVQQILNERDQQKNQNEAIIEGVNNLNQTTEANMRMNMSEQALDTGASESDVEEAAGFDANSKTFKLAKLAKRKKEHDERIAREKAESEKAKMGHKSMQDEDEEKDEKEGKEECVEEKVKKSKGTVFDTIGGFFSKVFGAVGGWFSNGTIWKVAGVGTVVAALFGKQIVEFMKKAYTFMEPYINKAKDYLSVKVPEMLHTAGEWISENGPKIISKITSTVVDNMSFIVDNAAKVIWAVLSTVGKKFANKVAKILGKKGDELPYPEVDSSTHKSFETEKEAQQFAEENGVNAHGTEILAQNEYVDENGDVRYVEAGSSGLKKAAVREGIQFARSATNRKMAKTTLKYGGKALGWVSGITPVGKVLKHTVKGGIAIGKAGVKGGKAMFRGGKAVVNGVRNKFGKKATEAILEEGTEELVEQTAKYAGREIVEEGAEKVAKVGAGTLAERTAKNSAKIAGAATGYLDDAGKWVSKATHQAQIEKSIARHAAKEAEETAAKKGAESVVKKTAEAALENVAESPAAVSGIKKVIQGFLEKARKIIAGAADKVKKYIPIEKFKNFVDDMIKTIADRLAKSNNKILQKIGEKISVKTAEATGRTAADATVIIGVGFAIFDGINGLLKASYLFGVDDSDVTAGMRAVSSIMEILLGTAPGAWIDILLEVWNMITGFNAKQWMARKLYTALGGDAEKLDESIAEMEAETEKYNKMNGTNISSKEYNELKNGNKGIGGRIKKGWDWLWSSKEDYDKKYNYDKYKVSDEELKNYRNNGSIYNSSNKAYAPVTNSNYQGTDLMYGSGPRGYNGPFYGESLNQGDPRWANFELGKFPSGGTSTMATGGCGPTALSMVAEGFGKNTDPLRVASYAKQKGYIQQGGATSDLFTSGASEMGLHPTELNKSSLKKSLAAGDPVIVSGKSRGNGPYTEAGHVVVANGLDSHGNAIVNDPLRGTRSISTGELERGMTHGWSYSGKGGVGYGMGDRFAAGYGAPVAGVSKVMADSLSTTTNNNTTTNNYFVFGDKKYKILNDGKGGITYQEFGKNEPTTGYLWTIPPVGFDPSKALASNYISLANIPTLSPTVVTPQVAGASSAITMKAPTTTSTTKKASTTYDPMWRLNDPLLNPLGINNDFTSNLNSSLNTDKAKIEAFKESAKHIPSLAYGYENILKNGTIKTLEGILAKIKSGKLKSGDEYKFNSEDFYKGLKVADIRMMALFEPDLLKNDKYPKFQAMYNYYVKNVDFKDTKSLNNKEIKSIFGKSEFIESLGGMGQVDGWDYKYGFPFYQTDDERWASIPWRGETVRTRGGDLATLGMAASVFGPNMISPDYINQQWLNINPQWWDSNTGLDMDKVFTDGGFNAMKASQVDGRRVQLKKLANVNSILSELRLKRPVVMTGYRYKGSMFGGYYDKNSAPTSGPDDYSTILARAADATHVAVLDPFTTRDQNGAFEISRLSDLVGSGKKNAILSAYSISGPSGEGVPGKVDISEKSGGTSDYTSIADAKGLDKVVALFKNFAAVGTHFLDMLVSDDHVYHSIYELNQIEGDGADAAGVGTAIVTDEEGNEVYVKQDDQNSALTGLDSVGASEYFKKGGSYYIVLAPGQYQKVTDPNFKPGKLNGWTKVPVPSDFGTAAIITSTDDTSTSVTDKKSKGIYTKKTEVEYFINGKEYWWKLKGDKPNIYLYENVTKFWSPSKSISGLTFKKIAKPSDFARYQHKITPTQEMFNNSVGALQKQSATTNGVYDVSKYADSKGVVKVTLPTTPAPTATPAPSVAGGSAISVNPQAPTPSIGQGPGAIGYGGGSRDLVFGPTLQQHKGSHHMNSSPNRSIKYLVMHYTAGVSSKTGSAENTAGWFDNPDAGGSADFIVDDGSMVQFNPDPKNQYCHAVGGSKYSSLSTSLGGRLHGIATNQNSISIEMTSNKANTKSLEATDTDWSFTEATLTNAATLANQLMSEYNIPKDNVIMHHEVTGKLCPAMWTQSEDKLSGWRAFQNRLNGQSSGITVGADGSVGLSSGDGGTTGLTGTDGTTTQSRELSASEKMVAYVNASMASMMGEDYETAKARYLSEAQGTSAQSADGGTATIGGTTPGTDTNVGSQDWKITPNGVEKPVPSGFGSVMSHMGWQIISSPSSYQYKLKQEVMGFDSDGLGKVGDRYAIAVKPYYGKTGDLLDVKYEDGTILKGIVADVKGCENEPGKGQAKYINMASNQRQLQLGVTDKVHADGSVVEWVVDKYGGFAGYNGSKTPAQLHPEYKKNMLSITKVGNHWGPDFSYGIGDLMAHGYFGSKSSFGKAIGYGTMSWLDVIQDVKNQIAANHRGYSYGGNVETITSNGYTKTFRTDCSGFVSICLSCYLGKSVEYSSSSFNGSCPDLTAGGFTKVGWPGWEGLQAGDILVNPGSHATIFAKNDGGTHYVWNCGSNDSCNSAAPTKDNHGSYSVVWRCGNPGSGVSIGIGQTGTATTGMAGDTTMAQQSSRPTDPLGGFFYDLNRATQNMLKAPDGTPISFGPGQSSNNPASWFTNTLGGNITSGYGQRSTQLGNEYHRGLDISAESGQDIYSPIDGEVVSTGTDVAGYGNYAVVRDNDGNNHIFAHMKNPVGYGVGSTISKNDVIGQVGSTGNATGDHLHYEIRKGGNKYSAINPMSFKYDSAGKSLNINKVNTAPRPESEIVGSGNRDVSTDVKDKLNVALETTNIEDKMDKIIDALYLMVDGINKPAPASSTVNNNTTNVSYGSGSGKQTSTKKSSTSSGKSNESMTLAQMHKAIATRK